MHDRIRRRLAELHEELEAGRRAQAELEARHEELRRTMLRIAGAIQVLGELLAEERPAIDAHGAAVAPSPEPGVSPLRRATG
jgi:hypothetical protein